MVVIHVWVSPHTMIEMDSKFLETCESEDSFGVLDYLRFVIFLEESRKLVNGNDLVFMNSCDNRWPLLWKRKRVGNSIFN